MSDTDPNELIQHLESEIALAPYTYEHHEQLIQHLRSHSLFDALHTSRERMSSTFTLPSHLWIEWVSDSVCLCSSLVEKRAVLGLIERGVEDCRCVALVVLYVELVIEGVKEGWLVEEADEMLQRAVDWVMFHYKESHLVWDLVIEFYTSQKRVGLVREMYIRRLGIAHSRLEETYSLYSSFESSIDRENEYSIDRENEYSSDRGNEYSIDKGNEYSIDSVNEYEKRMKVVSRLVEKSRKESLWRDKFEARLDSLLAYRGYMKRVKVVEEVVCLYERMVEEYYYDESVWIDYLFYLNVKGLECVGVASRGVKCVMTSVNVWLFYLLLLEKKKLPFSYEKADFCLRNSHQSRVKLTIFKLFAAYRTQGPFEALYQECVATFTGDIFLLQLAMGKLYLLSGQLLKLDLLFREVGERGRLEYFDLLVKSGQFEKARRLVGGKERLFLDLEVGDLSLLLKSIQKYNLHTNTTTDSNYILNTSTISDTILNTNTILNTDTILNTNTNTILNTDNILNTDTILDTNTILNTDTILDTNTIQNTDTIQNTETISESIKNADSIQETDSIQIVNTKSIEDTESINDTKSINDSIQNTKSVQDSIENESNTLFISDLPLSIDKTQLRKVFAPYGECEIRLQFRNNSAFAYVQYKTRNDAKSALEMHRSPFKVNISNKKKVNPLHIYISNIPDSLTLDSIKSIFDVEKVTLKHGFAYLYFTEKPKSEAALLKNGTLIDGKVISIRIKDPNKTTNLTHRKGESMVPRAVAGRKHQRNKVDVSDVVEDVRDGKRRKMLSQEDFRKLL